MIYRVKCTHSQSLLANIKKYQETPWRHDDYESYIEVNTSREANLIARIEGHQKDTFELYKKLLQITGEEV